MGKGKATVNKRFYLFEFLTAVMFMLVLITAILTMESQNKALRAILNNNAAIFDIRIKSKNLLDKYSSYFLQRDEESNASLRHDIEEYREDIIVMRNTVLEKQYFREIEDYLNMADSFLERLENGLKQMEGGKSSEQFDTYQNIAYAEELIELYYEHVYYALQNFDRQELGKITRRKEQAVRLLWFMAFLAGITTILSYRWFHRKVLNPIQNITVKVQAFYANQAEASEAPTAEYDELELLSAAFVRMKKRVERQMETERLLKESEVKAMQARINPHFMFNTLNSCAQMAYIEGAHQTEHMLEALSDYFRYNLKDCNHIVTIREEIKNLQDYISIQKMRFGKRISFLMECSFTEEKATLPALVLQPLVENALIHGVGSMVSDGCICVRIASIENVFKISIYDNGLGMSEEVKNEIKKMKSGEENTIASDGIGISNVYGRLYNYFGDQLVFAAKSAQGEGTTIKIEFPVLYERTATAPF